MSEQRVIAVCGKGGVGKTAFTAMLTKVLMDEVPGKLLVVDADPALGLNYAIGRESEVTIGSIREMVLEKAEKGTKKDLEELADSVEYLTAQALDENEKFSFLAMGRMNTIGCFCSVNDLLKGAIENIMHSFDVVLIDGEAGLEQINRQVIEKIDTLILVTDTSFRGLQTVRHIKKMVDEGLVPACKNLGDVFNRAQSDVTSLKEFAEKEHINVIGSVPYDKQVEEFDLAGRPLLELPDDNKAVLAVKDCLKRAEEAVR